MNWPTARASKRARRPAKGTKDQRRIWRFELKRQSAGVVARGFAAVGRCGFDDDGTNPRAEAVQFGVDCGDKDGELRIVLLFAY